MTGNKKFTAIITSILLIAGLLIGAGLLYQYYYALENPDDPNPPFSFIPSVQEPKESVAGFETFESAADFTAYLQEAEALEGDYYGPVSATTTTADMELSDVSDSLGSVDVAQKQGPSRVSETNVQVMGIDEPDSVKTNGTHIAYSQYEQYNYRILNNAQIAEPVDATTLIAAFPIEDLGIDATITEGGDVFMTETELYIISSTGVTAYDISTPEKPEETWQLEFAEDTVYHSARMIGSTMYLVTNTNINYSEPCPYAPVIMEGTDLLIPCEEVYHPTVSVEAYATFTAMEVNAENGEVGETISVLGTDTYSSSVYMSENALYIAMPEAADTIAMLFDFSLTTGKDLYSDDVVKQLEKVNGYELSSSAKTTEYLHIVEKYVDSLTADQELKYETELEDKMSTYLEENLRKYEKTVIAKIDRESMTLAATGTVPGYTLNQFSLDEYAGHLRVTTTVGEVFGFGLNGEEKSANDLYVLDSEMKQVGSVLDLGQGERIYATRLMGDVGYMVTFRETDPFYVFDLSDPENPEKQGELKIPGYSSYLHPIAEDRILGIGKEGVNLKLSLFDVSDPTDPTEVDKFETDDFGSEALYDHKAFLHDADNGAFFLPGYRGGYIFSYANDALKLEQTVSGYDVERAVYIDQYMYIISDEEVVVLDESNWKEVDTLQLEEEQPVNSAPPTTQNDE